MNIESTRSSRLVTVRAYEQMYDPGVVYSLSQNVVARVMLRKLLRRDLRVHQCRPLNRDVNSREQLVRFRTIQRLCEENTGPVRGQLLYTLRTTVIPALVGISV